MKDVRLSSKPGGSEMVTEVQFSTESSKPYVK